MLRGKNCLPCQGINPAMVRQAVMGTSKNSLQHHRGQIYWSFCPKMLANTSSIRWCFLGKSTSKSAPRWHYKQFLDVPLNH